MNFSVPEDVKQAFNQVFQGQNKSGIIAGLMVEAVEREQRRQLSQDACRRILERRKQAPTFSEAEFQAAREAGRR
jgi:hypothetical protein